MATMSNGKHKQFNDEYKYPPLTVAETDQYGCLLACLVLLGLVLYRIFIGGVNGTFLNVLIRLGVAVWLWNAWTKPRADPPNF